MINSSDSCVKQRAITDGLARASGIGVRELTSITAVLFGLAANADNLGVGVGYGLKGRRISFLSNAAIASLTTAVTLLALVAGDVVRKDIIPTAPNLVGGSLFIAMALWGMWRDQTNVEGALRLPDLEGGGQANFRETLFLAAALSVNNIGLAFAGGLGAIGYGAALTSIFGFSMALLSFGWTIGARFNHPSLWVLNGPLLGNAILVCVGVMMLFGI